MPAETNVEKFLVLSTVLLVSACSITQEPVNQEELQQAALNRWNNCIERHRDSHDKLAMDLHKVVSARCEGHQRDVLATFPLHLENQVNSLLSKRADNMTTEYFLRSSNLATWNIPESTHVDTFKMLSPSAPPEDL
jgi:hypothetical protein